MNIAWDDSEDSCSLARTLIQLTTDLSLTVRQLQGDELLVDKEADLPPGPASVPPAFSRELIRSIRPGPPEDIPCR